MLWLLLPTIWPYKPDKEKILQISVINGLNKRMGNKCSNQSVTAMLFSLFYIVAENGYFIRKNALLQIQFCNIHYLQQSLILHYWHRNKQAIKISLKNEFTTRFLLYIAARCLFLVRLGQFSNIQLRLFPFSVAQTQINFLEPF